MNEKELLEGIEKLSRERKKLDDELKKFLDKNKEVKNAG